jgi:geranylgeranyl reductase family protein
MRSQSAIVVGAGPAGVAAAVTLARRGISTTLIDRATFPRDKCCGDGLTTLALRELEQIGLDPSVVANWSDIGEAWLRSPSGREVCLPLPTSGLFAAVAPRRDLDFALVNLARAEGVTVLEGVTFSAMTQNPEGVHVSAIRVSAIRDDASIELDADWLVAADGMWSPVRKSLDVTPPSYLGEWHAFRQYASNVTGPARDRLIVWFEEDLLPGYAWSFPLPGGRVNIGFGVLRDGSRRIQDMAGVWRDFLNRPHIRESLGEEAILEDRHTAWPIPARIDSAVTGTGRVLFTGDAVMACDILTGEGIGQALLTGRLAGEAIASAHGATVHDIRQVRNTYRDSVRHHLVADHRMSRTLSRVLAHSRGARGVIAFVARTGTWGRTHFARWMFEDEPRAIALTPSRWHHKVLRSPGAYRSSTIHSPSTTR